MHCLARVSWDASDLLVQHPPIFHHHHKQAIFKLSADSPPPFSGPIEYARWEASDLPSALSAPVSFKIQPGVFTYPNSNGPNTIDWHVNFADRELFVAYGSHLLAQDELQVLEHPILGSVKEALDAKGDSAETIRADGTPTPITITGAQRRCVLDTLPNPKAGRPHGLYGNAFACASQQTVLSATYLLNPSRVSNILAMAALPGGYGEYHPEQILFLVKTAYTGFGAARSESVRLHSQSTKTIVHSGFWGCGAFGGDRTLMTIVQLLAAELAGVDLVYYVFDREGSQLAAEAVTIFESFKGQTTSTEGLLELITAQKFEWRESDGN